MRNEAQKSAKERLRLYNNECVKAITIAQEMGSRLENEMIYTIKGAPTGRELNDQFKQHLINMGEAVKGSDPVIEREVELMKALSHLRISILKIAVNLAKKERDLLFALVEESNDAMCSGREPAWEIKITEHWKKATKETP
jgi:hypothetical protein